MEAKDLMIGDWVYSKADMKNVRVRGVRTDCGEPVVLTDLHDTWLPIAEFEHIPLNGEILERSGFEKISESSIYDEYRLVLKHLDLSLFVTFLHKAKIGQVYSVKLKTDVRFTFNFQIPAVHDLQHAMRMCGIEKEIIL